MDNTTAEISDGTFRLPLSNKRYTAAEVERVFESLTRIARGDANSNGFVAHHPEQSAARETLLSVRGFV